MLRIIALSCLGALVFYPPNPAETSQELVTSLTPRATWLHGTKHEANRDDGRESADRHGIPYSCHALAEQSQWTAVAMWIGKRTPRLLQVK